MQSFAVIHLLDEMGNPLQDIVVGLVVGQMDLFATKGVGLLILISFESSAILGGHGTS